eukprot:m.112883 g.112883  ORF g.112883 m.112883 type:complete len:307 (-) comp16207_c1_seq3:605-1525(-)
MHRNIKATVHTQAHDCFSLWTNISHTTPHDTTRHPVDAQAPPAQGPTVLFSASLSSTQTRSARDPDRHRRQSCCQRPTHPAYRRHRWFTCCRFRSVIELATKPGAKRASQAIRPLLPRLTPTSICSARRVHGAPSRLASIPILPLRAWCASTKTQRSRLLWLANATPTTQPPWFPCSPASRRLCPTSLQPSQKHHRLSLCCWVPKTTGFSVRCREFCFCTRLCTAIVNLAPVAANLLAASLATALTCIRWWCAALWESFQALPNQTRCYGAFRLQKAAPRAVWQHNAVSVNCAPRPVTPSCQTPVQ